jgi:hypothetical protein
MFLRSARVPLPKLWQGSFQGRWEGTEPLPYITTGDPERVALRKHKAFMYKKRKGLKMEKELLVGIAQ